MKPTELLLSSQKEFHLLVFVFCSVYFVMVPLIVFQSEFLFAKAYTFDKLGMKNYPSYLFGQHCLFGQYGHDVIGEPAHVLIKGLFPVTSHFSILSLNKSRKMRKNSLLVV